MCRSTKMNSEFRNWSDVRIFLAVVREGSTLAASRKLGVAQPTVARRIDALEHETRLTLFERDTRGFRPTDAARTMLPLAEAFEAAAKDFGKTTRELTETRPIRITAFSGNFSPRATCIFSEFSEMRPDVRFEFLPGDKVLNLAAGEADIALRLTSSVPDQTLICRKISTARFTLYGSESYARKWGLPDSPKALYGHRFITFQRDDVPPTFHNWLLHHVSAEQIVLSCHEVLLTEAAITAGRGLGIMNVRMAEADDTFIRCFEPPEELSMQHLMLISPQAHRRPEVREFTKFFAPRYAAIFK